jgi:S-adenosylmethionine synthetase
LTQDFVFTAESVSEGHPDKICDRISDAIVDTFLAAEPEARCGVETLVTTNRIVLAGEVRGPASITAEHLIEVARNAIREIGYEQDNFDWRSADISCLIHGQSTDIALGVDASGNKDEGSGDATMVFGYACNETPELMPAPIYFANAILRSLSEARHAGKTPLLGPDSKCQVTLQYVDGKPVRATKIALLVQHSDQIETEDVREIVWPYVFQSLPQGWMCGQEDFLVNPTGRFVIGGPDGETGLTGRRISEDSYGGAVPNGGNAFSGNDPIKMSRSGAYAARYLAKNVIAAGFAERCTIQLGYAIGVAKPLSFYIDTAGSVNEERLAGVLQELMDLSPRGIRTHLGLNRPIYTRASSYGHFGRRPDSDGGFSWEKLDLVDELRRAFGEIRAHPSRRRTPSRGVAEPLSRDPTFTYLSFIVPCDSVNIEIAKSVLSFFSSLLRRHLPNDKFEMEVHDNSQMELAFTLSFPQQNLNIIEELLRNYINVVGGRTEPEELYSDPILTAEMRIQRRQAFVALQNRIEILGAEKQSLNHRVTDLQSRLAEVREERSDQRRQYEHQIAFLQSRIIQLEHDLSKYVDSGPAMVMAALRIANETVSKPNDLPGVLGMLHEIQKTQTKATTILLNKLVRVLQEIDDDRTHDDTELSDVVAQIHAQQPGLLERIHRDLMLGTVSGVAGNALWAAILNILPRV